MRNIHISLHRAGSLAIVALSLLVLVACGNEKYLADPKLGDIYAVEATHFESFDDGPGNEVKKAYGLMKVASVSDAKVTFISSRWYVDSQKDALREMRKYQPAGEWNSLEEKVVLDRDDLMSLGEQRKIFGVYRKK